MTYEEACKQVAEDWRQLAREILDEDAYASHVTLDEKLCQLDKMLAQADEIERAIVKSFTIAQRVYEKMTGVCKPLLG